tara:strand:- start:97 stop:375 length:279 start_codon:yes stop_codon:yes gene_type:complete
MMCNIWLYALLGLVLYLYFFNQTENMDDTAISLKKKLLKKIREKKRDNKKINKKLLLKKKINLENQKNLNLIKDVELISKQLDDGMKEIDSW